MGTKENKDLVLRLHREGFPGDPKGLTRYYSAAFRDHGFFGDLKGLQAALATFKEAYPNCQWKVERLVAEGDQVAVHVALSIMGQAGPLRTMRSTSIYRLERGRIVEHWGNGDPLF